MSIEQNTDRTIDGMNSETFDEINIIDRILVNQDAGENKQVLQSNGLDTLWGDVTDIIPDESITTAMLQDNCVTEEKISDALIFNMTTKSTLSDSDFVAISDVADSNKNKKLSISKISELSNTYLAGTNLNLTGTSSPYTFNLDTDVTLTAGNLKARGIFEIDDEGSTIAEMDNGNVTLNHGNLLSRAMFQKDDGLNIVTSIEDGNITLSNGNLLARYIAQRSVGGGSIQSKLENGDVSCLTLNGSANYTTQQTLTINNSAGGGVGTFNGLTTTITLPSPHSQLSAGTNIDSSSLSSGTIATTTSPQFSGTTSLNIIGGIAGDPIDVNANLDFDSTYNIVDADDVSIKGTASLTTIDATSGGTIDVEANLNFDDSYSITDADDITMSGKNNFVGATSFQKLNILQSGTATTFDVTNSITEINTGFRLTFTATATQYEFVFCAFCWMLSQNDYLYFDLYDVGNTTVLIDDRVFMYPDESDGTFLNVRFWKGSFVVGSSYTVTIRAKESSTGASNKIYMSGTFYPDASFGCMPLNSGVATFFDPAS